MLILSRADVCAVLDGAEEAVCRIVSDAYVAHAGGQTSVPHSVFLRFPDDPANRIIALPAFVGGDRPVAALKWIASFPRNIARDRERASAVVLLNSVEDGTPVALVEGSVISARRTAASAAVAADLLTTGARDEIRSGVTLIGCGVINAEVLRFLRTRIGGLTRVTLFDLDRSRALTFRDRVKRRWPDSRVDVAATVSDALSTHRLVSLATTAPEPHLDPRACRAGSVLLHLSLRDLTPASILAARNVVDDADHVCRAATSIELAARIAGDRSFITATIGDLIAGRRRLPYRDDITTVFSPFGLGALDAAVAAHVVDTATALELGVRVPDFAGATDAVPADPVTEQPKESHVV